MEKVKITLVVPERIAALVQLYIQRELIGTGRNDNDFTDYLTIHDVEDPYQYLPEMEIGIEHPDDEPVKIASYLKSDYKDIYLWIRDNCLVTYQDKVLDEHLYSLESTYEIEVNSPKVIDDFIQSVKATDCSYFRFVNS